MPELSLSEGIWAAHRRCGKTKNQQEESAHETSVIGYSIGTERGPPTTAHVTMSGILSLPPSHMEKPPTDPTPLCHSLQIPNPGLEDLISHF